MLAPAVLRPGLAWLGRRCVVDHERLKIALEANQASDRATWLRITASLQALNLETAYAPDARLRAARSAVLASARRHLREGETP